MAPQAWRCMVLLMLPKSASATATTNTTVAVDHAAGKPGCKCVEWAGLGSYIQGDHLLVKPVGLSGATYKYPMNYGNTWCKAHDHLLPPFCGGTNPPAWCKYPWCYVNKNSCTGASITKTQYFNEDIYWSYETCAQSNAVASGSSVEELVGIMEGYLRSTRSIIESGYKALAASGSVGACDYMSTCPAGSCTTCSANVAWGSGRYDFENVGLKFNPSVLAQGAVAEGKKNMFSCLAEGVSGPFRKIAAKEMDSAHSRVGYQYFGDHESGNYAQWPQSDWCPAEYDPRFRPWFASAVTGPKDVVIVVDVSGSMSTGDRDKLARLAVKKILLTLSWKDFATVILFHHGIYRVYSELLVPVTTANRDLMTTWADTGNWRAGSTNFKVALDEAFKVIGNSVNAGATSMCQKAILFLTDGLAPFDQADFTRVRANSVKYDTVLFTYALGSNAETVITKQLACENRGVFYKVPDGGDLATIMASYYDYFATGQEICLASFVKYSAFTSGTAGSTSEVYTGCLPSYDRVVPDHTILGVGCMDLGLFGKVSDFKLQASWNNLVCKISDQTKTCRQLNLDECRRQKVRLSVGSYSVCSSSSPAPTSSTKCGCVDRNCFDDTLFVDEKKYFCDTWIGDDCTKAIENFGYSAQGQADVLVKCKSSCGLCPWLNPCPYPNSKDCTEVPTGVSQCRACVGKVSGTDINGDAMSCPTGNPSWNQGGGTTGGGTTGGGTGGGVTGATQGSTESAGGNMGIIVGAAIGGLAVLGMVIGGCLMLSRRKPQRQPPAAVGTYVTPQQPGQPVTAFGAATTGQTPSGGNPQGPRRVELIVPPGSVARAPVPTAWTNTNLATNFSTIVGTHEDPAILEMMQDLVERTYKKVSTRDRGGRPVPDKLRVQIVQRVENGPLWQEYCNARQAIAGKRSHRCTQIDKRGKIQTMTKSLSIQQGLDDRLNEVMLWHGTSPAAAAAIAKGGFSLRHSGSNAGTMYGSGIYLAECSSKSDEYAKEDTEGLFPGYHCLLLCRAVLGEPLTMGPGGEAVHSTIDAAMNSGKFECVLGDREAAVGTYREFMVYTERQVYPEYIIMYTRE